MSDLYTNKFGDKYWYNDKGEYHRENGPAIEYNNGTKYWYLNDKKHREDGPAIKWSNGDREWYVNGERHREDGPAVELINGDKWWYYNGECIASSWEGFTQEKFKRYLRSLNIKEYW